jgi:hypothetical protein
VDPGENGAILNAGGGGGPGPPGRGRRMGSWHQTVEEIRCSQDVGKHGERARHDIKVPLCTEYISLCVSCVIICCILDNCNREPCLTVSICFRRINHMEVKKTICIHPLVHEKLCRSQLNTPKVRLYLPKKNKLQKTVQLVWIWANG